MEFYRAYRAYNLSLAQSVPGPGAPAAAQGGGGVYPRLAVYMGGGSSHSWLWFVKLFERLGLYDLTFVDHEDVTLGGLDGCHALAVSGGDTFGMAEALGASGAKALEKLIRSGGLYMGSCAGAYLFLNSSKKPLDLFNWVPAKITNLSSKLPQARDLPEKFCTPYGCSYVYHPVREAVRLEGSGREPWTTTGEFQAPLYGGPAMIAGDEEQVLARYKKFTPKTKYLVEPELAASTLISNAAVLRTKLGKGTCYLFGPHLEHPHYVDANRLLADAMYWDLPNSTIERWTLQSAEQLKGKAKKDWLSDLKREVSNVRIVVLGLESHPARWLIGRKVYEPAKLRVFAEAVWESLLGLERLPILFLTERAADLVSKWKAVTLSVRLLYRELHRDNDTQHIAEDLFPELNLATARFMELYFHNLLEEVNQGRKTCSTAA
jgi:glutamine amidotransferase-like uncharacterized protein